MSLSNTWLAIRCFIIGLTLVILSACGGSSTADTPVTPDIPDTTAPVITLNGSNNVSLVQGKVYTELGATALDNIDGSVAVTISGTVDTSVSGEYIITYSATDSANNSSVQTRVVLIIPAPYPQGAFVTTWKTDNDDDRSTPDDSILIRANPDYSYNYTVDWGDGTHDENVTGDKSHRYSTPGTYTVAITGDFPHLVGGCYWKGPSKILSVEQWGNNKWKSMYSTFSYCSNLSFNATDVPDLSFVTNMREMFSDASNFNEDISAWDVSSVTDMGFMFAKANAFNQDISAWDVSSVRTLSYMFAGTDTFNQDISAWDVSSVTDMRYMFRGAVAFNQDLSAWDISSVTNMRGMFSVANAFNQDLSAWDVSLVTDMRFMFNGATTFNQDLSAWDTSSVTNMRGMFSVVNAFNQDLTNAFNQDLSAWDVSSVTDMQGMFNGATTFNQDLSSWDVSSVKSMADMFADVKLSTQNYDALLNGWSMFNLQNDVTFDGGDSQYSGASQSARDALISAYGWTITDGGFTSE